MATVCSSVTHRDTEYAVVGYCRQIENDLYTEFIPDSVIFLLCIKYYFMSEHFGVHGTVYHGAVLQALDKGKAMKVINFTPFR